MNDIFSRQYLKTFCFCILVSLSLQACSFDMYSASSNRNVMEEKRIHLSDADQSGLWQSNDLHIAFTSQASSEKLNCSGTLFFSGTLLASFPVIKSFSLRIHLLGDDGRVTATYPVAVNYPSHGMADASYSFRINRPLAPGTTSFTFSYLGTFSDYGERRPDTTFISFPPPR